MAMCGYKKGRAHVIYKPLATFQTWLVFSMCKFGEDLGLNVFRQQVLTKKVPRPNIQLPSKRRTCGDMWPLRTQCTERALASININRFWKGLHITSVIFVLHPLSPRITLRGSPTIQKIFVNGPDESWLDNKCHEHVRKLFDLLPKCTFDYPRSSSPKTPNDHPELWENNRTCRKYAWSCIRNLSIIHE